MNDSNLENELEKPSFYDFTRKSVVGAGFRVGTSFMLDAAYLSLVAASTLYAPESSETVEDTARRSSNFLRSLDAGKLARVTGFVIGINFMDYRFDVTNKLDRATKSLQDGLVKKIKGVF